MVRRAYKKLVLFSLWAMLFCVAVSVLAQASTTVSISASNPPTVQASTTGSTSWTPANWIALITAISSAFVAIVGALKSIAAQKTADTNSSRLAVHEGLITTATSVGASAQAAANAHGEGLNAIAARLDGHDQQINELAKNQLPPAMLASMMPRTPQ